MSHTEVYFTIYLVSNPFPVDVGRSNLVLRSPLPPSRSLLALLSPCLLPSRRRIRRVHHRRNPRRRTKTPFSDQRSANWPALFVQIPFSPSPALADDAGDSLAGSDEYDAIGPRAEREDATLVYRRNSSKAPFRPASPLTMS
jgi:hypothetical protein